MTRGLVKRAKLKHADALQTASVFDEAESQRGELAGFVLTHGLPLD
jgi:hypothetical protein